MKVVVVPGSPQIAHSLRQSDRYKSPLDICHCELALGRLHLGKWLVGRFLLADGAGRDLRERTYVSSPKFPCGLISAKLQ